jgi:hypothetical protein
VENFNQIPDRNDIGGLWENFLIVERMKSLAYKRMYGSSYFWRTYTGAEIDYLEEKEGKLTGYEFKWKKSKTRNHLSWQKNYPEADFKLINNQNYLDFLLK